MMAKLIPHITRWLLTGILIWWVSTGSIWASVISFTLIFLYIEIKSLVDYIQGAAITSAIEVLDSRSLRK